MQIREREIALFLSATSRSWQRKSAVFWHIELRQQPTFVRDCESEIASGN
jgi:hypothetical protein